MKEKDYFWGVFNKENNGLAVSDYINVNGFAVSFMAIFATRREAKICCSTGKNLYIKKVKIAKVKTGNEIFLEVAE